MPLDGKRLLLSATDGKPAGAYRRIEEQRASAVELRTRTYRMRITEKCLEGEVGCRDVRYDGLNIRTGSSITLNGQAVMRRCADRVTPCGHQGYRFTSGEVEYRVMPEGLLLVTQGTKVLVEKRGQWQTTAKQRPPALGPLAHAAGVQVPSDDASARAKLLAMSWKPDSSWGTSGVSGRPAYVQYPGVMCGQGYDAVCSDRFQKADEAILLTIDPRTSKLQVTAMERD